MADELSCKCNLQLNPDITGIGVRAALYAQIMLGWVISRIWTDTFVENSRTAFMTATALLIASFIQLSTQVLSLLDGLVVSLITSMMIAFLMASSPSERRAGKATGKTQWFMQFCFVIFWGAWCFNLWRDPVQFGLSGELEGCGDSPDFNFNYNVTIWMFGHEVHATDPGVRTAAITLVSIGFFIALCSLFFTLEQVMEPFLSMIQWARGDKVEAQPRDPEYEDPVVESVHHGLQTFAFATLIYLTISTERTILKNDLENETGSWSYGQTIALILLLQQLMAVLSTWIEKKEGKKNQNKPAQQPNLVQQSNSPQQDNTTQEGAQQSATGNERIAMHVIGSKSDLEGQAPPDP